MWPRMLALGVVQVVFVVTVRLASRLEPGSIAAFQFGWILSQMPQTVLGTAVGIVAFPTLSHLAALGRVDELRRTAVDALRAMILLSVPAAVGLAVLAEPAIDLLLRTGQFTSEAAELTRGPLQMFAVGLVGHVTLELLARLFYAQKDTWTPLLIAGAAMALNVVLAVALVAPLRVAGLALANSIAVLIEVALCLGILDRRLGGFERRRVASAVLQSGAASAVMALLVVLTLRALPAELAVPGVAVALPPGFAALGIGGAVGAIAYVVGIWLLGVPEVPAAAGRVLRRGQPLGGS
jgi:putative peptidoglycan lipid II flippase